jgi:hypothetical protein
MFVARYKPIVPIARAIASRLVALVVAMSFVTILVPIAGASKDDAGVMACCIGMEAGHCDSGISAHKPPPPPPEPMCGLTSTSLDEINPNGEPPAGKNEQADAESGIVSKSPSVRKPCPMSCGACTTTASRLQKRQKDFIQAGTSRISRPEAALRFENLSPVFSSSERWTSISLRGPPLS